MLGSKQVQTAKPAGMQQRKEKNTTPPLAPTAKTQHPHGSDSNKSTAPQMARKTHPGTIAKLTTRTDVVAVGAVGGVFVGVLLLAQGTEGVFCVAVGVEGGDCFSVIGAGVCSVLLAVFAFCAGPNWVFTRLLVCRGFSCSVRFRV